jgi:predicted phage-related endonuclease
MLTRAQHIERRSRLGGSDMAALMTGNAERILRLYAEKIGEIEPENLSHVWPVRLGECTEQLSLDWYSEKNKVVVSRRGEVAAHWIYPWAAVTLDGWDETLACPIEAKHCGGHEPIEVIIDRYQPQCQWIMECTGASQCGLSVIMGAREPVVEYIERDEDYAEEEVRRGGQFWRCVVARTPPVALPAVPAPVDASKVYDMTSNNHWADQAIEWLSMKPMAVRADDAQKVLKSLVPADAKRCFGHGVQITRDRAGRLSLREMELPGRVL